MNCQTHTEVTAVRRTRGSRRSRYFFMEPPGALWEHYRGTGDVEARNALIEAYVPIVRREAQKLAAALANTVTVQELESAGILGLIDSIDSFDPSHGFQFITHCTPRVRGAMFDELRRWDWTPRATRAKLNRLARTAKALEEQLGFEPDDCQLAEEMGLSRTDVRQLFYDRDRTLTSLDHGWTDGSGRNEETPAAILRDHRDYDPLRDLQKKELARTVRSMLTGTERLVIILYYYEQLSLREIGELLGRTESRVSQIHGKVVRKLRRLLE